MVEDRGNNPSQKNLQLIIDLFFRYLNKPTCPLPILMKVLV